MENTSVRVTANFRPNAMNYKHNIRDEKTCKREKNVDLSHYHENIVDMGDEKTFFNKLFEESVKEYNSKQKRSDRRIENNDYLTFIKKKKLKSDHKNLNSDGKIKPVTEIEFKIGNRDNQWPNRKHLYKVLRAFVMKFDQLYGHNVKIVGAFLHDDEYSISKDKKKNKIFNPPHVHLDIVYVAHSLTEEEIRIEDQDRERIRHEKMEEYKKEGKKWEENLWKKIDWTEYRVNKFGKSLRNGLSETCSMSAALAELGFRTCAKKQTAQIQFQHDVHKQFQDFCEDMGLNIDRTKVESHKHVSPDVWAEINENRKREIRLKKQELINKHNMRILNQKEIAIMDKNAKIEEAISELKIKKLEFEDQINKFKQEVNKHKKREREVAKREEIISNRQKVLDKKEDEYNECKTVVSYLQSNIRSIKDELKSIDNLEKKATDYYQRTKEACNSIKLFSKGVRDIITKMKYDLNKYKDAFKNFFNFTPKNFRLLADSMEKNNCQNYRDYHNKMEIGNLDWQINKKNNKSPTSNEFKKNFDLNNERISR